MSRLSARDLATITALVGVAVAVVILSLIGSAEWALIMLAALIALVGTISRIEFAARRGDIRSQLKHDREMLRMLQDVSRATTALRSELIGVSDAQKLLNVVVENHATTLQTAVSGLGAELHEANARQQLHEAKTRQYLEESDTRQQLQEATARHQLNETNARHQIQEANTRQQIQEASAHQQLQEANARQQLSEDFAVVRSEIRGMRVAQQLISQKIAATKDEARPQADSLVEVRVVDETAPVVVASDNDEVITTKDATPKSS